MTAVIPNATNPVIIRLTRADFPAPGWAWTQHAVLVTNPILSHSARSIPIGSAVSWWRPMGTPAGTAPDDTAKGNNTHA